MLGTYEMVVVLELKRERNPTHFLRYEDELISPRTIATLVRLVRDDFARITIR